MYFSETCSFFFCFLFTCSCNFKSSSVGWTPIEYHPMNSSVGKTCFTTCFSLVFYAQWKCCQWLYVLHCSNLYIRYVLSSPWLTPSSASLNGSSNELTISISRPDCEANKAPNTRPDKIMLFIYNGYLEHYLPFSIRAGFCSFVRV